MHAWGPQLNATRCCQGAVTERGGSKEALQGAGAEPWSMVVAATLAQHAPKPWARPARGYWRTAEENRRRLRRPPRAKPLGPGREPPPKPWENRGPKTPKPQVIAVHADDPEFKHFTDISQLPSHRLAEIKRFFEDYKKVRSQIISDQIGSDRIADRV